MATGWNGSGTFTRGDGTREGDDTWAQAKAASQLINTTAHDTHDEILADGIEACLAKNGENAMTGTLDMGSQSISNWSQTTNVTWSGGADFTMDGDITAVNLVLSGNISGAVAGTFSGTVACDTIDADNSQLGLATGTSFTGNIDAVTADIETANVTETVSIVTNFTSGSSGEETLIFANQQHSGGAAYTSIGNLIQLRENSVDVFKIDCVNASTRTATLDADLNAGRDVTVSGTLTAEELIVPAQATLQDAVIMSGLPTSSVGLPANSLWNDSGTLKIT